MPILSGGYTKVSGLQTWSCTLASVWPCASWLLQFLTMTSGVCNTPSPTCPGIALRSSPPRGKKPRLTTLRGVPCFGWNNGSKTTAMWP
eukprot:1007380-Prymnesium_polylepis.1